MKWSRNSASARSRVVDVQALAGDSVDNVPGVPGIGVKTAAQLITEYGDLDTLLARAGEIKQPKRREKLIEFADQARVSRELVRLKDDVPLPIQTDQLAVHAPQPETVLGFLQTMEFSTLTRRIAEALDAEMPDKLPAKRRLYGRQDRGRRTRKASTRSVDGDAGRSYAQRRGGA